MDYYREKILVYGRIRNIFKKNKAYANGYYMDGLAILISIASFILSKKEVSNVQTTGKEG
ncbi:hypothetical protein FH038_22050 [Bacillus sp. CD3-1a]|nr:hypothetical protein FH038_22050 [Bacillus sp. CD3-1a]